MEDRALWEERAFIHALGGYTIEVAGAHLVTHERIPVPRFNFVQDVSVAAERQSAFFERMLDHYFQRALRPSVRVRRPVPAFLDRGLRAFAFRTEPAAHTLLAKVAENPTVSPAPLPTREVREAELSELDAVLGLWTHARERDEFRRSVEVAWQRPNPGETLRPVVAVEQGRPVGACLVHVYRDLVGVYAVTTAPESRGRGVATDLVRWAVGDSLRAERPVVLHTDDPRLALHLAPDGFTPLLEFQVYALPEDAELALPPPGPLGPPRWRPPRRSGGGSAPASGP